NCSMSPNILRRYAHIRIFRNSFNRYDLKIILVFVENIVSEQTLYSLSSVIHESRKFFFLKTFSNNSDFNRIFYRSFMDDFIRSNMVGCGFSDKNIRRIYGMCQQNIFIMTGIEKRNLYVDIIFRNRNQKRIFKAF